MGKIEIWNMSTLRDHVVVLRVGYFMAGYRHSALCDSAGNHIVKIKKINNRYVVSDFEMLKEAGQEAGQSALLPATE